MLAFVTTFSLIFATLTVIVVFVAVSNRLTRIEEERDSRFTSSQSFSAYSGVLLIIPTINLPPTA